MTILSKNLLKNLVINLQAHAHLQHLKFLVHTHFLHLRLPCVNVQLHSSYPYQYPLLSKTWLRDFDSYYMPNGQPDHDVSATGFDAAHRSELKRKAHGISRSLSEVFAFWTHGTASLDEAKKLDYRKITQASWANMTSFQCCPTNLRGFCMSFMISSSLA